MAYATRAEVLASFDDPPADASRLARIDTLLAEAEAELDMELGFDFNPHTETRTFHGTGAGRICIHDGLVSVTSLAIADSVGGTYTTIAPSDYFLENLYPEPAHPYDHLTLSTAGAIRTTYPKLQRVVQITGTFGFASVPLVVRAAVIDRVRQRFLSDAMVSGAVGPEEFGRPTLATMLPDTMYRVIRTYRGRFYCHV